MKQDGDSGKKSGAQNPAKIPAAHKPATKKSDAKKSAAKKPVSNKRQYQKYQRPRGGAAKSISDLVPEIGRAAFRRYGFIQSSVVSRWPEIVGAKYAGVSLPESIRFPRGEKEGGTLHLIVSGAHATMMQHISPEIISRVNRFFGYKAVCQLRFRQGEVCTAQPEQKRTSLPPSLKPVPIELGDSLRDIGDPELNKVLESLSSSVGNSERDKQVGAPMKIKITGKIGGGKKREIKEGLDE